MYKIIIKYTGCFLCLLLMAGYKPFLLAQEISDIKLKPYVVLWQSGYRDTICRQMPFLKIKFPEAPEIFYFSAGLTTDGQTAYTHYKNFIRQYPSNILADECLLRIIQYEVSLGLYEKAGNNLALLKTKYPKSPFYEQGVLLFPDSDNITTQTDTIIKNSDSQQIVYTIQVGAFSDLKNAEKMRKRLIDTGYGDIEIKNKINKNKPLYLVFVGSFSSKDAAEKSAKQMNLSYTITVK